MMYEAEKQSFRTPELELMFAMLSLSSIRAPEKVHNLPNARHN
jgi:hypothetical protein